MWRDHEIMVGHGKRCIEGVFEDLEQLYCLLWFWELIQYISPEKRVYMISYDPVVSSCGYLLHMNAST